MCPIVSDIHKNLDPRSLLSKCVFKIVFNMTSLFCPRTASLLQDMTSLLHSRYDKFVLSKNCKFIYEGYFVAGMLNLNAKN